MKVTIRVGIVLGTWCALSAPRPARAEAQYYASGLLQSLTSEPPKELLGEREALSRFFATVAPREPGFEWRRVVDQHDGTHVHDLYQLYCNGRRVVDQFLRVHYNRDGWVQYASSSWKVRFPAPVMANPDTSVALFQSAVRAEIARDGGDAAHAKVKSEAVVWIDPREGTGVPALEVRLTYANGEFRHFIAEEKTGRVLHEYPVYRTVDLANVKAYKVSPLKSTAFDTVTLSNLTDLTKLASGALYVQRVDGNGAKQDIDPKHDYTLDTTGPYGFTTAPTSSATYHSDCVGTTAGASDVTSSCPNQGFDGTNVYYQIGGYRAKLDSYFSKLGIDTTTGCGGGKCLPSDPIRVLINQPSIGSGSNKIDSNNAAYIDDCTSLGFDRCMIFLKPAPIDGTSCGGTGTVQVYDLAREGTVIVHEFQHYVTDANTHMVRSPTDTANVGDALHEGYSDYFGASHVVDTSGNTDATKVLAYGFQNCPVVIRDVATLRPYGNGTADQDPHTSGLTWASGLWQLRTQLGREAGDLLVLKSQYFMPTSPNFIDAVESLVKADLALNQGANVATIRTLFYSTLKFLGGKDQLFRDPNNLIAEVGFSSCAAAHGAPGGARPWAIFLAWLAVTLVFGRGLGRRARA